MGPPRKRRNPSTSSRLKIGSSSGIDGGGDKEVGDPDVVIKNEGAAAAAVFSNHLLIEKIIKYAVHSSGNIYPKTVGAVRAVQKSWLEATTTVLKRMGKPVITLDWSNLPSQIQRQWTNEIKPLEEFTEVFSDPARLQRSFLPYKLIMEQESFYWTENYKIVLDCLRRSGAELAELVVNFSTSQEFGIPPLNFPSLRKLTFNFERDEKTGILDDDLNHNPVCSLQYILWGSPGLVELVIEQDKWVAVPKGLQCLLLPDTLVSLEIDLKLESQDLEVLVLQLKKLENLKLTLYSIPFEDGLLFKILERFRKTLKRFNVYGVWWGDPEDGPCRRTYLEFPVMEKLETLDFVATECELSLGPWCISGIEKCLPKLNYLVLLYQTEAMLAKWLDNYKSDSVEKVKISLINEELEYDDDNFHVSIKPEMLAQVKSGFPNLRDLRLDLNFADMDALKYLFKNMKQLTTLLVHLIGEIGNDGCSKVDSILVGKSLKVVKSSNCWQTIVVNGSQRPGIMNLSELRKLVLSTENWESDDSNEQPISLISDLVFSQVLMKMSKLRELEFYGKFKPSDEMRQNWTEQEDRTIMYFRNF